MNRLWKGEANINHIEINETHREQEDDVKHKLLKARSKFEVANAHKELEYIEQVDYIICRLCFDSKLKGELNKKGFKATGAITTSNVREPNFENDKQDKEFRNLKSSVLTHIESQTHRENGKEKKELND